LNNPNYTGVLNVNIQDDDIYGIMNGGFRDGKYITLLTRHGIRKEEFDTIELELYPRDSIITDNDLIIVGSTYLNEVWVAKLIVIDLVEFKIKDVIIDYDNYRFNNVAVYDEFIYLITENFDYITYDFK